jgi:hypothetical protein
MTEQKFIVNLDTEHLVFFYGELDGEVVGIVAVIVRTPTSYLQSPQAPAR